MKILYLLLLIAIPTWGLDRICPRRRCKLKSKDVPNLDSVRPRLTYLELGSCQYDDLETLLFTPNLKRLIVLHCESDFSTIHLAAPPNLEALHLRLGDVTYVPPLGNMSKLEMLDLRRNRIEGVAARIFLGVTNLRELFLQDNWIGVLPKDVFHPLEKLEYLDLSRNHIALLWPSFLPSQFKMKALYLRENPLLMLAFDHSDYPRSIDEIDLTDCRELKGDLNFPFEVLTLTLTGSGVESVNAFWLIKLNAANSKLYLSRLGFFDNFMPNVKELNLRGIDLDFDQFTGVFGPNKLLEIVDLSNNSITRLPEGSGYRLWSRFKKLNLSRNGIQELPVNCPLFGAQLTSLDASYNRLRGILIGAFERAYDLESLFLQGNQLFFFEYRSDKLYNLRELALYDNDFDEKDCTKMEEYFKNNTLKVHRSSQGYVCGDPVENSKEIQP